MLLTETRDLPQFPAYSDAIKLLQGICTTEIQRLAMKMPDHLMVSNLSLYLKFAKLTGADCIRSVERKDRGDYCQW